MFRRDSDLLAREYFELVHTEPKGDKTFQAYRPRDKLAVLFSLIDGSPLASIALRCQTTPTQSDADGTRGNAIITERPDSSELLKFQGMVDRDGQEIELVITNLGSKGHINFNILKTDESVQIVNPGGLNEVNELRQSESYAVKCDQENNLSLILSTFKNLAGETISVRSDEETSKQTGKKAVGTYFFLSVVPQAANAELCKRFESTTWKCVDLIVRSVDTPPPICYNTGITGGMRGDIHSMMANPFAQSNAFASTDMPHEMSLGVSEMPSERYSLGARSLGTLSSDEISSLRSVRTAEIAEINSIEVVSDPSDLLSRDSRHLAEPERVRHVTASSLRSSSSSIPKSAPQPADVVMESRAATIEYGRRIEVSSRETGIDYDYERAARCLLSLSISSGIKFFPELDAASMISEAQEIIRTTENACYIDFLKRARIYDNDECSICLEAGPDTIFYQCGHRTIHLSCMATDLRVCPLCRARIKACLSAPVPVPVAEAVTEESAMEVA